LKAHNARINSQINGKLNGQINQCFDCHSCRAYDKCLGSSLAPNDLNVFKSLLGNQFIVERGDSLFKQGKPVDGVYILRSGSFKYIYNNTKVNPFQDKILEFFLNGDIMALDCLHLPAYAGTAIALESSSVCCISHKKLLSILPSYPNLLHELVKKMSQLNERVVHRSHESLSARGRILNLVKRMSEHSIAQGGSGKYFNFPISKSDMANYLGITQETVSRQLSDLKSKKVLCIKQKQVELY